MHAKLRNFSLLSVVTIDGQYDINLKQKNIEHNYYLLGEVINLITIIKLFGNSVL